MAVTVEGGDSGGHGSGSGGDGDGGGGGGDGGSGGDGFVDFISCRWIDGATIKKKRGGVSARKGKRKRK